MLLACSGATFAQTVVYDNTTTYTGVELSASGAPGNEITLAGTERIVTGINIFVRLAGDGPATFDVEVRFRKNDLDLFGELRPGTVLWFSGRVPLAIDSGAPVSFHFDVPRVDVPDTFTCTIWLTNQQGNMSTLGLATFSPPTIGSARPGVWLAVGGPQLWEFLEGDDADFGAKITAVNGPSDPIPAVSQWGVLVTGLLLLIAGTAVVRRRRSARPLPYADD